MDNPVYFYPFVRMSSSLTSPKPRRNQEYTQEDILTTLEVNDVKAKEEFDSQLSLLTSKVFKTPSTGHDQVLSPSVRLRKKYSINPFSKWKRCKHKTKDIVSVNYRHISRSPSNLMPDGIMMHYWEI